MNKNINSNTLKAETKENFNPEETKKMLRVFLYFEDASVCESVCIKISQCMYI